MSKVLIVTNRVDDHAKAVAYCLEQKGALPIIWYPDEFLLNQRINHRISTECKHSIILKGEENIDLTDIDVVWYRRSNVPSLSKELEAEDIKIIEAENRMHMRSVWLTIGERAKWVNPFSSFDRSNSKILQLREVVRIGLTIPDTLISNDKNEIVNFIQKNVNCGTLYKTFLPVIWEQNDDIYSCYSSAVTEDILPADEILALTPGIYQKIINKKFEVRATFMGKECIAVKIHNSEELDWRVASVSSKLKISPITLPLEIEKKCILLMNQLNIVFGCFDFIVTPSNDYIFLEVNEMGQFLWKEEHLPELNLLDKFSNFILSGLSRKIASRETCTLMEYMEGAKE